MTYLSHPSLELSRVHRVIRRVLPRSFSAWLARAEPRGDPAYYFEPKGTVEPPVWRMCFRLYLLKWLYPDMYSYLLAENTVVWTDYYEALEATTSDSPSGALFLSQE